MVRVRPQLDTAEHSDRAAGNRSLRAHLALAVDSYLHAQTRRIAAGEGLRAILQGRDQRFGNHQVPHPADTLRRITSAIEPGPVPLLARAYAHARDEERASNQDLRTLVEQHPLWPWLATERGVGQTLAARLLARVEFEHARRPSSVWRFCGLGTVPSVRWRCDTCDAELFFAQGRSPRKHPSAGATPCAGKMREDSSTSGGNVASLPFVASRRGPVFDREAKLACYLLGISLLRTRSPRSAEYRAHRSRLVVARPTWPPSRCHLTALRIMVKSFLRDAWIEAHNPKRTPSGRGTDHAP